jgi:hypothetical protein
MGENPRAISLASAPHPVVETRLDGLLVGSVTPISLVVLRVFREVQEVESGSSRQVREGKDDTIPAWNDIVRRRRDTAACRYSEPEQEAKAEQDWQARRNQETPYPLFRFQICPSIGMVSRMALR